MTADTCVIPIVLIGMMGAGKTTIGKLLAEQLDVDFYDCDAYIEQQLGIDVSSIFSQAGEQCFRKYEHMYLQELLTIEHCVIATGGGAPLLHANQLLLQNQPRVVYVWDYCQVLFARIQHCQNRPLLQNSNPRQTYQQMYAERDPLYRSLARQLVQTNVTPLHAASRIIQQLHLACAQ